MCSECFRAARRRRARRSVSGFRPPGARRTLDAMSTFVDPPNPESFEHNGLHPEVNVPEDEEQDSFDKKVEAEFREFVGEAAPTEDEAPGA